MVNLEVCFPRVGGLLREIDWGSSNSCMCTVCEGLPSIRSMRKGKGRKGGKGKGYRISHDPPRATRMSDLHPFPKGKGGCATWYH